MTRRAIIATLMTALMLPVLIGLGLWQWQRLAWKEALIVSLKAADDARPTQLDETFPTNTWAEFDRVEAEGIFDHAQEQRVWTASEGRSGWRIITPMFFERPQPGDHMCNFPPVVYVERGVEPGAIPRKSDRPLGKVKVAGRLFSSETSRFIASGNTRPGEWTLADIPAMAKTLHPLGAQCRTAFATPEAVKTNLLPLLLVAENQTGFDLPVPEKRKIELANRHFEYALTWWSFAGILFVIWALFLRGEFSRRNSNSPLTSRGEPSNQRFMRYISTRGEAPTLDFSGALLAGLARDGGLYVPESWPTLPRETIAGFAGQPFHQVAATVLKPFVGGAISDAVLAREAEAAYATFGHPAVTPLVQTGPNRFILELFHGPTLAFKDVAMQLLARLMDHVLTERDERVTIVGATSGDTGGAAIEAFRGRARSDVVILFPDGRVSDVQRRMMTTPTEANVHTLSVRGDFDDCQALVKAMFNDHAFRDGMRLAGVNSINWARIVAQVTYYFVAAAALGAPHRKVSFCVPTGNFGDIFAGYVAKRMGLPVERLIIATNENDILARTLASGSYDMRATSITTSPSMDIQVSSNFERLLFDAYGRDAAAVRGHMRSLAQSKSFTLGEAALTAMRAEFDAGRASEAAVQDEMRKVLAATGYRLDPHTAVGNVVADQMKGDPSVPVVVLATAHPAKFPDAVRRATGLHPDLPPRLAGLMTAPECLSMVENDLAAVERAVAARSRITLPA